MLSQRQYLELLILQEQQQQQHTILLSRNKLFTKRYKPHHFRPTYTDLLQQFISNTEYNQIITKLNSFIKSYKIQLLYPNIAYYCINTCLFIIFAIIVVSYMFKSDFTILFHNPFSELGTRKTVVNNNHHPSDINFNTVVFVLLTSILSILVSTSIYKYKYWRADEKFESRIKEYIETEIIPQLCTGYHHHNLGFKISTSFIQKSKSNKLNNNNLLLSQQILSIQQPATGLRNETPNSNSTPPPPPPAGAIYKSRDSYVKEYYLEFYIDENYFENTFSNTINNVQHEILLSTPPPLLTISDAGRNNYTTVVRNSTTTTTNSTSIPFIVSPPVSQTTRQLENVDGRQIVEVFDHNDDSGNIQNTNDVWSQSVTLVSRQQQSPTYTSNIQQVVVVEGDLSDMNYDDHLHDRLARSGSGAGQSSVLLPTYEQVVQLGETCYNIPR